MVYDYDQEVLELRLRLFMDVCQCFVNITEFFKLDLRLTSFYHVNNYYFLKERDYSGFTQSKGPGKRGHIVADTLLPTQMFPRLPTRATSVVDTNFVSGTQKCF